MCARTFCRSVFGAFALAALCCILGACIASTSAAGKPTGATGGDWGVRSRSAMDGCQAVERFAEPGVANGVCVAQVRSISTCPDGARAPNEVIEEYTAIPLASDCDGLRIDRDFFSESAFGKDRQFLHLAKRVAIALREEARAPSRELSDLGETVVAELLERQMSAFVELQLDPSVDPDQDRYRAVFYLPESGITVVLLFDGESDYVEWALLLE
jgi:hypothetical protein